MTINIAPTIRESYEDIGYATQKYEYLEAENRNKKLRINSFKNFLNSIPKIQIREYTQDTRLDLLLSLVDYFKMGYDTGKGVAKLNINQAKALTHLLMYDCTHIKGNGYWEQILGAAKDTFFNSNSSVFDDTAEKKVLIDFCYNMYYRMLTTTSTNIYELPFNAENIYKGNGYEGWSSDFGIASGGLLGRFGAIGNFLSPNINLTTTPMWKGCKGGEGVTLEMTVNLFNDTTEHAINNFIFINTIIPQNLPTQYAILQQPPSLYDIKIDGFSRLFMCAGNFDVTYKGVLRDPGDNAYGVFFTELRKHVNHCIEDGDSFIQSLIKNNQIRIPDVYELKLSFKSLLPNTFNNYLFQFAMNGNITHDTPITQKSLVEIDKVPTAISAWIGHIGDDIDSSSGRIKDAMEYAKINEKNKEMNKNRQSIEQRPFKGDYNKIQTNNS